jgi:hypothetical protein
MTWARLQTTGGKDEPNNVNMTWARLQTTGGKDEPKNVNMMDNKNQIDN